MTRFASAEREAIDALRFCAEGEAGYEGPIFMRSTRFVAGQTLAIVSPFP